jgi:hypothetical protein
MVMRWRALAFAAGVAGFASACASSSTVQVPVDDARSSYLTMSRLDCSVYDEKGRSLTVGVNFSLLWGAAASGPFVQRGEVTGVKWDKSVQFIVAQYKEVCGRFNAGALTQAAYNTRLAEIDQLYAEAAGIRQNADDVIRRHSQQAFSELDKQAGEAAAQPVASNGDADNVVASVDRLMSQLGVP